MASVAAGLMGMAVSAVQGIGGFFSKMATGDVLGAVGALGRGVLGIGASAVGAFLGVVGSVAVGVQRAVTSVGSFIGEAGKAVGSAVGAVGRTIGGALSGVSKAVGSVASAVGNAIGSIGNAIGNALGIGSSSNSGSSSGKSKPVLIDLSGKGITVDTLQTSQNFFDFDGDGYQRRTAWAGAGTGVLVLDADGDGKISRSSEFAFTEWAEGSDSDLEALRRVFDTNHNNKLDAGDSRWAAFKIWLNGTSSRSPRRTSPRST